MASHCVGKLLAGLAIVAAALAPVGSASATYVLASVSRPGAASTALFDVNNAG